MIVCHLDLFSKLRKLGGELCMTWKKRDFISFKIGSCNPLLNVFCVSVWIV